MMGTGEASHIALKLSMAARLGSVTRTTSQPPSASARIWSSVASVSKVGVQVIDWTTTGAPPPICTDPTMTGRVSSRGSDVGILEASLLQNEPNDVVAKDEDEEREEQSDAHIRDRGLHVQRNLAPRDRLDDLDDELAAIERGNG